MPRRCARSASRTTSAGCRTSPSGRRSWSTGAVRSAAHGGTRRQRCRTSTSCSRPPGPCSARRRALPGRRRPRERAAALAHRLALPRARDDGSGSGDRRRPPAGGVPPLARRAPALARRGALARSVHVPAREPAALELRRLAVRAAVLAADGPLRARARLEPVPAADLRGGRRLRVPVAAGARAAGRGGADRRARLRARAVPRRPERRPPARARVGAATARVVGIRALATRLALVAHRRGCCASVDPVLGRPPRARRDPVLPPLRALPRRPGRRRARDRAGPCRRAARRALLDERDRRRRALAEGGAALLRDRARLRHAPPATRARELRLPRLAAAPGRPRGARAAAARPPLGPRRRAGRRCACANRARVRHALPALLDALAPLLTAALPARARAAAAGRLPLSRRPGRVRGRPLAVAAGRRRRTRAGRDRSASLDLRRRRGRPRQSCLRRGARSPAWTAAGAARAAPVRASRQRLPLVRPGRPAGAAWRLLDYRSRARREARAAARGAELRRLAAGNGRAAARARRPLRRLPRRPRKRHRVVRLARPTRPRLRGARPRRGDHDARARTGRRGRARRRALEGRRLLRRLEQPLAALPARISLGSGPPAPGRADDARARPRHVPSRWAARSLVPRRRRRPRRASPRQAGLASRRGRCRSRRPWPAPDLRERALTWSR